MKIKMILFYLMLMPIFAISQTNKSYIMINYSSICCGTPPEKPIIDFIKNFEKKNKIKQFEMFVESGLGKEGEFAFYIGTDNMKPKQLISFNDGLKKTASNQNKFRSRKGDGYVNVSNELTTNSTLKNIKIKPRTKISKLEMFDYKK